MLGIMLQLWKEHSREVTIRYFYIMVSFVFCLGFCCLFQLELFFVVAKPLHLQHRFLFVYTHITEAFITFWYVSFFCCLFFVFPFVLYQFWCFFKSGLYVFEKKYFLGFIYFSYFLLCTGGYLGYSYIIPFIWNFLLTFMTSNIHFIATIGNYTIFFFKLLVGISLLFELPVVIFFLLNTHIITLNFLVIKRFWFYCLLLMLSAFLAPPDIYIQFFIFVVLFVLYEVSLFIIFFYTNISKMFYS